MTLPFHSCTESIQNWGCKALLSIMTIIGSSRGQRRELGEMRGERGGNLLLLAQCTLIPDRPFIAVWRFSSAWHSPEVAWSICCARRSWGDLLKWTWHANPAVHDSLWPWRDGGRCRCALGVVILNPGVISLLSVIIIMTLMPVSSATLSLGVLCRSYISSL